MATRVGQNRSNARIASTRMRLWDYDSELELALPLSEGDGSNAYDVTRHRRDFTLYNGATWGNSVNGRLLFLDGSDDYVQADSYKGITGTNPFTLSVWFSTTSSSSFRHIAMWGAADSSTAGVRNLFRIENGVMWMRANAGRSISWGSGYNDGVLHHACFTRPENATTSEYNCYVDGVKLSPASTGTVSTINLGSGVNFLIGAGHDGTIVDIDPLACFSGYIGNVRLYNRQLTDQEVFQLYATPWLGYRQYEFSFFNVQTFNPAWAMNATTVVL